MEEVLSNAVYHKGYDQANPIEVQVFPEEAIEVLSYPGPVPPIDNRMLQRRRVAARHYRNRRIGEFLKELDLTEGKATGFPVIRNAMQNNGSPAPEFFTDEARTLFQATLKIHPWFTQQHPENREHGKIHISAKDWNIQSLEDVDALLEYLWKAIYDQITDQVRAINKSSEKTDRQEDEVSGVIERTIDKTESDQVTDQVGKQVEGRKNERIITKYSGLGYPQSNYVEDIVGSVSIDQVTDQVISVVRYCYKSSKRRKEILEKLLKLTNHTFNYRKYLLPLINMNWLKPIEKGKSSKQSYQTTTKGKILLLLMSQAHD